MANRVPFGGGVKQYPYWDRIGLRAESSAVNLTEAKAARFLPILLDDEQVDAPIVMYPGTLVGVLNTRDQDEVPAAYIDGPAVLAPAHGHASGYTCVYTSLDLATHRLGGTPDLDSTTEAIVTSTGASTNVVKPLVAFGVVQEPVYSTAFQERYTNLRFQPKIGVLTGGRVLTIPCITAEEKDIYPGDLVMVSNTTGAYDPLNNPATTYPGRWKKFDPTASDCVTVPYVVGRCVERFRIVRGTAVQHTLLKTDIANAAVTTSTLNQDWGFHTSNRVQTTPGFILTGSGSYGIPYPLTYARADSSGDYWAIQVAVSVPGLV